MSCPRHGNTLRVDLPQVSVAGIEPKENHGEIRCDCLELLLAALAPLKMGKWVRGAFGGKYDKEIELEDAVEERANRAIHEAILAAYHLGLRGGVDPKRVRTCPTCGKPWLAFEGTNTSQCTSCWTNE